MKKELIKLATEAGDMELVVWLKANHPHRFYIIGLMNYYRSN